MASTDLGECRILSPELLQELNAVIKDIRSVDVLFGYCYPSTYRAGMTGLATHLFYCTINQRDDTSCERYFRYDTASPIHSVESGRELRKNHIIGFSLTYEEDIIGVLQMLETGSIKINAKERTENDPIVIMGGPVVSANPEPYVDFIDAFVIGEGDYVIHSIIDSVANAKSRQLALDDISDIKGVYVPSREPEIVERVYVRDLNSVEHPIQQIVPDVPEGSVLEPVFGRSFLVEVARGCGHACKFCLVGHICRPRRVRSLGRLKEIVREGVRATQVNKISLIASSLGDLDGLEEFAEWIVNQGLQLSVPSLRADSVTEELLVTLIQGGQRTLTIAPETGTDLLRATVGKGLDNEDILRTSKLAVRVGYRSLKLYYIIGLPDETDEDVRAIAEQVREIAKVTGLRVIVSVNPFIPKAHTRYERIAQPPIEEIREKMKIVSSGLHNVPRTRIESLDPRRARIQASLSLADRRIGPVIEIAAKHGGLAGWRRAEKKTGIAFFSIANDQDRLEGELPWKFIKMNPR